MTARWIALVPAKPLASAKTRCVGLSPAARRALAGAMLADVVHRLREVPAVESVVVVATDPETTAVALAAGAATAGSRRAHDLNAEVADALALTGAAAPGAGLAVVMADLAGARTEDHRAALAQAAAHQRALVADADGTGTTMLALRDPADFRPFLGPGSLHRFLAAGYHSLDVGAASPLRRDVDTVDQLLRLDPAALGPATRGWLAVHRPPAARVRAHARADERKVVAR